MFKKLVCLLVILGLASTTMALPAYQAYYKLNGDYTDSSTNGYNASIYKIAGSPDPTFVMNTAQTIDTQASWFGPHVGGQAQVIRAPNAVGASSTGLTIACWLNMTAMAVDGGDDYYVAVNKGTDSTGWRMSLDQDSDRPYLRINGVDYRGDNNGAVLPGTVNQWKHWTMTYDRATGSIKYYVNGVQQDSNTAPANVNFSTSYPMDIGGKIIAGQYDEDWRGGIDEVMVWNTPLSATDVAAAYQIALLPEPATALFLLAGLPMLRRRRA